MPVIFETDKFLVLAADHPHHDRNNGGRAKVMPKQRFGDRTEMANDLYLALMQLVRLSGEAITTVIRRKGIDVVRINYQDMGNWCYFPETRGEPHIHVQLYVRSNGEKHPTDDPRFRAFPEALFLPYVGDSPEYYESFQRYSDDDCKDIKAEIEQLLQSEKYLGLAEQL